MAVAAGFSGISGSQAVRVRRKRWSVRRYSVRDLFPGTQVFWFPIRVIGRRSLQLLRARSPGGKHVVPHAYDAMFLRLDDLLRWKMGRRRQSKFPGGGNSDVGRGNVCVHGNGAGYPGGSRHLAVVPIFGSTSPLAIAALLAGALWYPYLRFEAGRNFVDVRSQVLRESIRPIDFSTPWCDPALVPATWLQDVNLHQTLRESQSKESRAARARRWVSERIGVVIENALTNFGGSFFPGAGVVLFALTLIGLAASLLASKQRVDLGHARALWRHGTSWLAS
jgi:hypothetical protein